MSDPAEPAAASPAPAPEPSAPVAPAESAPPAPTGSTTGRRYFVSARGATLKVEVERVPALGEGGYRVRLGERVRAVDCREIGPNQLSLRIDGEVETYLFEDRGGEVVAHDGRFAYAMVVEDERQRLEAEIFGRGDGGGAGPVRAVMPGIVVQVLVGEGEAVEQGQPLVVMEAMKMENEVRADRAGRVQRILVKPRDTVEGGQPLVELA